jgi:hypothetical protein
MPISTGVHLKIKENRDMRNDPHQIGSGPIRFAERRTLIAEKCQSREIVPPVGLKQRRVTRERSYRGRHGG